MTPKRANDEAALLGAKPKGPTGLILRPSTALSLPQYEDGRYMLGRRRFIVTAATATAGAIWLKPLHVEAKDSWWRRLLELATNFATGILFSSLGGGGLSSILGNLGAGGLNLLPQGNGLFGLKLPIQATPGDPTAAYLQKILAYAVNSRQLKGAMGYVQKILDRVGVTLPTNFPTTYLTGQAVAALGGNPNIAALVGNPGISVQAYKTLLQDYLSKYTGSDDNFKSGLMLPQLGGRLPYAGGISLGADAVAQGDRLTKLPPAFYENFELPQVTESGTIMVLKHVAENLKMDGREVDSGQSKTNVYIIPAKSDTNPLYRRQHKNVVDWISRHSNYWSNEGMRKEFYNVLFSNAVIQPATSIFAFQREVG